MAKEVKIEVEGKVLKINHDIYEVELTNVNKNSNTKTVIEAYVSGKMRKNTIRILPGDIVTVKLSPYDVTRGFITYRKNGGNTNESKSVS